MQKTNSKTPKTKTSKTSPKGQARTQARTNTLPREVEKKLYYLIEIDGSVTYGPYFDLASARTRQLSGQRIGTYTLTKVSGVKRLSSPAHTQDIARAV